MLYIVKEVMIKDEQWNSNYTSQELNLENNELHIWRTKVSELLNNLDSYWKILNIEEQKHANSFNFTKDRNRYIIARSVLRILLEKYLKNIQKEELLFDRTKYGKPYLCDLINLHNIKFNLSHSYDYIVYAFTKNNNVGVDIEFINRDIVIEDIIENSCSEQEKLLLNDLNKDDKCNTFYKFWVIKEAIVKAMGVGMSFDLRCISVNLGKNKLIDAFSIVNNSKLYWTVELVYAYNSCCSAFATRNPIGRVFFLTYQD